VNTDPLLWIVAKELHAARKRQRLSQKRLAELADVSENTVYLIEAPRIHNP
jgi:DNA-binding XRE family transcriptional regulator